MRESGNFDIYWNMIRKESVNYGKINFIYFCTSLSKGHQYEFDCVLLLNEGWHLLYFQTLGLGRSKLQDGRGDKRSKFQLELDSPKASTQYHKSLYRHLNSLFLE